MCAIKKASAPKNNRLAKIDENKLSTNSNIIFSFERLEHNEYFNLDGTCVNWSFDLFNSLKEVSKIEAKRVIVDKEFSNKNCPLRIHNHNNANPPCNLPEDIELEQFYQIRISKRKGGIHGFFYDNIFYVVWFDPQHNMYPNDNFGGLKRINPPSTCCKERDIEIDRLNIEVEKLKEENDELWKEVAPTYE